MPIVAKPKKKPLITQAAEKVKSVSPFPRLVNDILLPTETSGDVGDIPVGGEIAGVLGKTAAATGVTAVAPEYIAKLRAFSNDMIQKILSAKALEKRSLGMAVKEKVTGAASMANLLLQRQAPRQTVPITNEMAEAIQYAQLRYPRLLAHNIDIADVDALAQVNSGLGIRGASAVAPTTYERVYNPRLKMDIATDRKVIPADPGGPIGQKGQTDIPVLPHKTDNLSRLGFSPGTMSGSRGSAQRYIRPGEPDYGGIYPQADTVGHELLHSADRLTMGDKALSELYQFSNKLPGGYDWNAQEIRARMQGAEFGRQFQEWKKAGKPTTGRVKLSKTPK